MVSNPIQLFPLEVLFQRLFRNPCILSYEEPVCLPPFLSILDLMGHPTSPEF